MHNAAGHYAEADEVANQGPLCRSCSRWYLVAALNAVLSFDQPHSKKSLGRGDIRLLVQKQFWPQNPHH